MDAQLTYTIKKLANNRCKIKAINANLGLFTSIIEEVKIPSEIDGCRVIGIGNSASETLRNRVIIKNLFIPNTIESIGEAAFFNVCIKKVVFEENSQIQLIDTEAFSSTTMEELDINAKRSLEIGCSSFSNTNLEELDLTKCTKIKCFGENCFSCSHLKTVKLPSNIKELGREMFQDNYIEDISFLLDLKDCTLISEGCFSQCYVSEIPDEIFKKFYIGNGAFTQNNFEQLEIPEYAQLGQSVFAFNIHLKSVIINTEVVPYCIFKSCVKLEKVTIRNATAIHAGAFNSCALSDLTFEDDKLQTIANYAFMSNNLTKLSLENTNLKFIGHMAFAENQLESVELPYYLTEIFSTAFDNNESLHLDIYDKCPFIEVKRKFSI